MKNIIKYTIAVLAVASVFTARAEREYQSICQENRIWIYSNWWFYRPEPKTIHSILRISGTTSINDKIYHNCYLYDYDYDSDYDSLDNPFAYLRQENGKVYMLNPSNGQYEYGSDTEELLIYDFSLEPGDEFQVGKDEYYSPDWSGKNYFELGDFLPTTNNGRIKCLSTSDNEHSVKQMELYFPSPYPEDSNQLNYIFTIQEGIGFLKWSRGIYTGYMPYPYNLSMSTDWHNEIELLYVCDVEEVSDISEGNFGEVIYRQEGMPENPKEYFDALAVEDIRADEYAAPEYFNIQGMLVSNPTEGEIYIVKRGSKASKEVYRR